MLSMNFNLKTKSGKNLEFLQTMGSILVDLRKVKGSLGIDFQQDAQDQDQFCLRFDWQNKASAKALLASKAYNFFEGAMQVLCEAPIVEIDEEGATIKIDTGKNRKISIKKQIRSAL